MSPDKAKKLIRSIVDQGTVNTTTHVERAARDDGFTVDDCVRVLRSGFVSEPEWENGEWRYHATAGRQCVVISFQSQAELTMITTWRL